MCHRINENVKVSILSPITHHIFHIHILTSVLPCWQKPELCDGNSSFSVFLPVSCGWLFQQPPLGAIALQPKCAGAEQLILWSLKCLCKCWLMKMRSEISFEITLCCRCWETLLFAWTLRFYTLIYTSHNKCWVTSDTLLCWVTKDKIMRRYFVQKCSARSSILNSFSHQLKYLGGSS